MADGRTGAKETRAHSKIDPSYIQSNPRLEFGDLVPEELM